MDKIDLKAFADSCRSCNPAESPEQAAELLEAAAVIADEIIKARNKKAVNVPYDEVVTMYNGICRSLPKLTKLSDKRKRSIKSCFLQGNTLDDIKLAFEISEKCPFLLGKNERGWRANFDFIMKPDNLLRIIEGAYGTGEVKSEHIPEHSYNLDLLMEHAINNTPKIKQ